MVNILPTVLRQLNLDLVLHHTAIYSLVADMQNASPRVLIFFSRPSRSKTTTCPVVRTETSELELVASLQTMNGDESIPPVLQNHSTSILPQLNLAGVITAGADTDDSWGLPGHDLGQIGRHHELGKAVSAEVVTTALATEEANTWLSPSLLWP